MLRKLMVFGALMLGGGFPALGQNTREIAIIPIPLQIPDSRPANLAAHVAAAASHPLGSWSNPVRVHQPMGQRVYLVSLRCADGRSPRFDRKGSTGNGAFGTIVDAYEVVCPDSTPAKTLIYMDMYHPDHRETQAAPGFGFVPPTQLRMRLRLDGNRRYVPDPQGPIDADVLIADIAR